MSVQPSATYPHSKTSLMILVGPMQARIPQQQMSQVMTQQYPPKQNVQVPPNVHSFRCKANHLVNDFPEPAPPRQ